MPTSKEVFVWVRGFTDRYGSAPLRYIEVADAGLRRRLINVHRSLPTMPELLPMQGPVAVGFLASVLRMPKPDVYTVYNMVREREIIQFEKRNSDAYLPQYFLTPLMLEALASVCYEYGKAGWTNKNWNALLKNARTDLGNYNAVTLIRDPLTDEELKARRSERRKQRGEVLEAAATWNRQRIATLVNNMPPPSIKAVVEQSSPRNPNLARFFERVEEIIQGQTWPQREEAINEPSYFSRYAEVLELSASYLALLFQNAVRRGVIKPFSTNIDGVSSNTSSIYYCDADGMRAFVALCWGVIYHMKKKDPGKIPWEKVISRVQRALGPAHKLQVFIKDAIYNEDISGERFWDKKLREAYEEKEIPVLKGVNAADASAVDSAAPKKSLFTPEDLVEFKNRWTKEALFALYDAIVPLSLEQVSPQKVPNNVTQAVYSITEVLDGRSSKTRYPEQIRHVEFNPLLGRILGLLLQYPNVKNLLEIYIGARKREKMWQAVS